MLARPGRRALERSGVQPLWFAAVGINHNREFDYGTTLTARVSRISESSRAGMITPNTDPQPLRIFLVENHADTLRYLTMYLEQMGHSVVSAACMQDALARLPSSGCEVLISDIGLPDGNGWDLLSQVHVERPLYAIAMSGYGMNADLSRSKAAGYRRHLLKPINPDELDAALDEAAQSTMNA